MTDLSLPPPPQRPQHPNWPEQRQDLPPFNAAIKSLGAPAEQKARDVAKDFFDLTSREACESVGDALKGNYAIQHNILFNLVGIKGGGVIYAGELIQAIENPSEWLKKDWTVAEQARVMRIIDAIESLKEKNPALMQGFLSDLKKVPANFKVYQ